MSEKLTPNLEVFEDEAALGQGAAERFVKWGRQSIGKNGLFRAALSGGRGPRGMFRALTKMQDSLDWSKVELYWVDERWVPWSDPESSYADTHKLWLDGLPKGPKAFPMWQQGLSPELGANAYEALLKKNFGSNLPVFDLCLLGMGPDGHTASLFPGQAALEEKNRLCIPARRPKDGEERITLTLPVLNASDQVAFILSGMEKKDLLKAVLEGKSEVPASKIRPSSGKLLWLADRSAGGN
jgi:6-phosphogluconolactonase